MTQVFHILQMVVGLGLVIFVHELGHFLAARWCGVRVRVFSLGFGPPLLSIMRGETRYQIAAVPIGGFVSMQGEFPGERKGAPDPGDLLGKSVSQRFFVYSAGVLMNLAFAVVVLPLLFWVGVPFRLPVVGEPEPGSAAWTAGITEGTEIVEVDGTRVFEFDQITVAVALADRGPIEIVLRDPGQAATRTVTVDPKTGSAGFRVLGVMPGDPLCRVYPDEDGAARRAGMRDGDRLLGVIGLDASLSPRQQIARALDQRPTEVGLRLEGSDGVERRVVVPLDWKADGPAMIGVAPHANVLVAVRGGGELADHAGRGARLVRVRGVPIDASSDLLDAFESGDPAEPSRLELADGRVVDVSSAVEAHLAARGDAVRAALDIALDHDTASNLVAPTRGGAALAAGLLAGDRVVGIDGRDVTKWQDVLERIRDGVARGGAIQVAVEREGTIATFAIEPAPLPNASAGFAFDDPFSPNFVYRTANPLEAVGVGLASAREMLGQVWIGLRKIVTAEISSRNIGGVISMGAIGIHTAREGPSKLFYFLCLLSINLAVINVLPIPVLDGGHLLFLLVEKLKGGPVSERVLGYSQLVGFVMIVSLVVYVTWNDLQRWVIG